MPAKKSKAPEQPPAELSKKEPEQLDDAPHEGHHYLTIVFLVAVLFTIIFLIPPAIVPLPQFGPFSHPIKEAVPAIQNISPMPPKAPEPASDVATPPKPKEPEIDYDFVFIRTAYEINKQNNYGLFESKLQRIGFYTYYDNTSKQQETQFRADIWVRNAGKAKEDFNAFNGYIKWPPTVYKVTGGTFNGEDVAPGEIRQGYLLYGDVPQNMSGQILLSIGTSLAYSAVFGFQTQNHYSYAIQYPPEAVTAPIEDAS